MFGNFGGEQVVKRSQKDGAVRRSRTPVFEMLEQRAMLTTFTPLPGTADGATGSLRADLALANADTGTSADVIQLSAGAYDLTSSGGGQLEITNTTHSLVIEGAGLGSTKIDQLFADRVFKIDAGATVFFQDLEITGGTAKTDSAGGTTEGDGGGILNLGTAVLTGVEVDRNTAQGPAAGEGGIGGGIYSSGTLTIGSGSVVSDNNADGAVGSAGGGSGGVALGGGIYSITSDPLTITDTTVIGNGAVGGTGAAGVGAAGGTGGLASGGGLYLDNTGATAATLSDDTISGNNANSGNGGAGDTGFDGGDADDASGGGLDVTAGSFVLSQSTVSGNTLLGGNGGVKGTGGTANGAGGNALGAGIITGAAGSQMLNDTVYGNTATGGSGSTSGNASGGGLNDSATSLTIVNVTVAANSALVVAPASGGTPGTPSGGGIAYTGSGLVLENSLIATNTATGSPDFSGTAATAMYNLVGDITGAGGFTTPTDHNVTGVNAKLATAGLINNGGNTNTVALQPSSPALAAGSVSIAIANGLTTDQRGAGFARIVSGAVDIGALETQTAGTTTSLVASPNPATVGSSVTFTAIVTPASGASGTPTGTVQFVDGTTDIGPAETLSLVNGVYQATFSTSTLALGSHPITAVYSGDPNFTTSTSPIVTEVVGGGTGTVDLSTYYNVDGITTDGTSFSSGGLDGQGNALSESLVGRTQTWSGITFPIAPANTNNVVQAVGQVITLTPGSFSSLAILATGTNGNQPDETFTITYAGSGGTVPVTQSISDWHMPQSYAGESIALQSGYRNTASGGRDNAGPFDVFGYLLPVDSTKTITSITLPSDSHVKILAIAEVAPVAAPTGVTATALATPEVDLAWTAATGSLTGYNVYRGSIAGGESGAPIATLPATATSYVDTSGLVAGNTYFYTIKAINYPAMSAASTEVKATIPTSAASVQADLANDYNLMGITADGQQFSGGGLDGNGNALSANQLGTSLTINGVTFNIAQGGTNNVVQATGQTIGLPNGSYSHVEILATGTNGNQSGTFFVNYATGSATTITQSISDWHMPQSYSGETVALSMSYRNMANGSKDTQGPFDVYAYSIPIDDTRTLTSITLPSDTNVKILGIVVTTT